MIQAWRIVKQKCAKSAIKGTIAKKLGSRWNNKGRELIYSSGSMSLAAFELLVHYEPDSLLNVSLVSISVMIPEEVSITHCLNPPKEWDKYPAKMISRDFGDNWLKKCETAVLCVPSAMIDNEYHYLINPRHPHYKLIEFREPMKFTLA